MSTTEAFAAAAALDLSPPLLPFQTRSHVHMLAIAKDDPTDVPERRDRFHEEALEVAHKLGTSREDAHRLVDYVWGRPAGDLRQEIGQALKTLADLASETGHDMMACGEQELARTWQPEVFAKIQRKRANRHGRGPLPGVDGGAVTKVIVSGGQHPAEPPIPDGEILRRETLISCPEAIRAVCDHDGKRWRVEGAGWVMQPVGCVTLGEAETICRAVERALTVPAPVEDPFAAFFAGALIPDAEGTIGVGGLYSAYVRWARGKGDEPWSYSTFSRRLMRSRKIKKRGPAQIVFGFRLATDDITPEAVATLQASADAVMTGETWETIDSPEVKALRDLAHVLEAQIEDGEIGADGMALVCGALARAKPGFAYTGKDCEQAECKVHGPCDECPTEGLWQALESKLTTWLAEHPREVVIPKTAEVGTTESVPDARPWQPAGAYPVDGTIIEVEGRGRMRSTRVNDQVGGWLGVGLDGITFSTHAPTTRWRSLPPVRV